MSNAPVLLFLHGVGTGDPKDTWKTQLAESLARVGHPDLDGVKVIAPKFAHALKGADEKEPLPPITLDRLSGEKARTNRREFERRIGAVEFRLGHQDRGNGYIGGDVTVDAAVNLRPFVQARNYLKDAAIRAQVLNRVLSKIPTEGEIVIVGHSLGSVIAADVISRLPKGVRVRGMVTIGSPLASETFGVDKLRDNLREPPSNLDWWVSFWDGIDPVAARRGVSSAFPWMIDFRVPTTTLNPKSAHQAVNYLSRDVVAEAIGFALFGSRSRDIVKSERSLDHPLNAAESISILALRYAHLVIEELEGEQKTKYAGAVRAAQAIVVETLQAHRLDSGDFIPNAIARLAVDLSDAESEAESPAPLTHLPKEEAVVPLVVLASENVILPFEIKIAPDKRQRAMENLTAELGLTTKFGEDLFAAAKAADKALAGGSAANLWIKWGVVGVGAVAIVVATGGLALAAGAGLAGAAALTSALAAFGPGGMIGGLLTAGALVTAGGGGIAFGLASPGTSPEALEAVVSRQVAAELLRKAQKLDRDPGVWSNLVATEIEVRRQLERLDEFSDPDSPTIKNLERKLTTLERALTALTKAGLAPAMGDAPDDEEKPKARGIRFAVPGR